jgi:uncharacterized membrane protein YdbT with pleckstrin-like domain
VAFSRSLLEEGEELILETRQHFWPLVRPGAFLAGAIALLVGISVAFPHAPVLVNWICEAILAAFALMFLLAWLKWVTALFVVTNRRVLSRQGVLVRNSVEARRERIVDVRCRQSLLQRSLHAGNLLVATMGAEEGAISYEWLPHPKEIQGLLLAPVHPVTTAQSASEDQPTADQAGATSQSPQGDQPASAVQGAPGAREAQGMSIFNQIERLDQLRRKGILTEDEFAKKKRDLLDRM